MKAKEVKFFNSKGQKLVGYYRKNPRAKKLFFMCHGIESYNNIPKMVESFDFYYEVGLSLFWFDFTGFGKSEGKKKINVEQFIKDIGSAIEYAKKNFREKELILAGGSLAGLSLINAAVLYKKYITKLYIVNGLFTLSGIGLKYWVNIVMYILFHPQDIFQLFLISKYYCPEKITVPTLLVVGMHDKIVDPHQSLRFYKGLRVQKKLLQIPDGDHSLLDQKYIKYVKGIGEWLLQ